ncbi:MAG: radical SAM protein [Fervidobacterium sp.]|nr:radical SAM protein [Fervidobacterium sp.]
MRCVIIDGYVDEPAVLGVPPYVSTYVRYTAGLFIMKGFEVDYYTIDQVRANDMWHAFSGYDIITIIGGVTVPGRYVGGTPITPDEVKKLLILNKKAYRILIGAIGRAYAGKGASRAKYTAKEFDVDEIVVNFTEWISQELELKYTDAVKKASLSGAEIVRLHPRYPDIICEIEISLGCERRTYCTFCTEPILYPKFFSRPVNDILDEIEKLYKNGVKSFRLGRSANIVAYGSDFNNGSINPTIVHELYSGIRDRCKDIRVLHTDNANPTYISKNLPQSSKIIEVIAKYNTSGDILSFGVESFDPIVRKKNNIEGSVEDIDKAVEIVNTIGGFRDNDGIPKLLPGINLIFGLFGESKQTYRINYEKLKEYLDSDLLLRRINLRQIMIFPETPLYYLSQRKTIKPNKKLFEHYKYLIRTNVDNPMLKKVFPTGSIIRYVIPEFKEGNVTFGRPLGTYPILIGIPGVHERPIDVVIVGHGQRSLTGIRLTNVNNLTIQELENIPGVGRKNAERIKNKDFSTLDIKTHEFIRRYFSV